VSGEDAVLTDEEVEEEHTAGEDVLEEGDVAVARGEGEGEALCSFLEVGIFGLLRSHLVNFLAPIYLCDIVSVCLHTLLVYLLMVS
jgi:hypothetical protein